MKSGKIIILFLLLLLNAGTPITSACSDFLLKVDDSSEVVSGRTIDWFPLEGMEGKMKPELRDQEWNSISSFEPEKPGLSWTNTYGFIGIGSNYPQIAGLPNSSIPQYLDTLNEEGLSAAFLSHMEARYPDTVIRPEKALLYMDLLSYIAGNFKNVEEVKEGLQDIEIWCPSELAGTAPYHLVVHDASKKSLIVEWVKDGTGKSIMEIYDGKQVDDLGGVLTNDPSYPIQLKNLDRYSDSTPENFFAGLPGGPSSPDRFVRLTKLNACNIPVDSENQSGVAPVMQAFHLLNSVDVVNGQSLLVLSEEGAIIGSAGMFKAGYSIVQDNTYISIVRDHTNRAYYFKTQMNQNIGMIDLKKMDFVRGKYHSIGESIKEPDIPYFTDITGSFE